jgi:hypothetical protein
VCTVVACVFSRWRMLAVCSHTNLVSHTEYWTEEFRCAFALYSTAGGCQYLQVNYANGKGHQKFRNNWLVITQRCAQWV